MVRQGTLPIDADIIVIGCGPAGMTAAVTLSDAGCSVIVLDMSDAPGGQIYRALETNARDRGRAGTLLSALGPSYTAGLVAIERFRAAEAIDYRPGTTVWEVRADGTVGWLRGTEGGYLRARHVVLANGAMERPTPFPGWTLPGVMTAGAVQTLLKAGRLKPEGRVALAGTGPLMILLAHQLLRLGVRPVAVARTDRWADSVNAVRHLRPGAIPPVLKGLTWLARLRLARVGLASGITSLAAVGSDRVTAVSFSVGNRRVVRDCDLLVVHDGIVPAIDLAHGAGLALEWDAANASWRPRSEKDGQAESLDDRPCRIRITGDARKIGGADAAVAHGGFVAAAILRELGNRASNGFRRAEDAVDRTLAARPFLDAAFPPGLSTDTVRDDTIVCRCEELSARVLRIAIRAGARDINQLRGETRCGMGPCQGRNCTVTVSRLLAEAGAEAVPAMLPTFRARPPARPISLGALATLGGLDPEAAKISTLEDKPQTDIAGAVHAQDR